MRIAGFIVASLMTLFATSVSLAQATPAPAVQRQGSFDELQLIVWEKLRAGDVAESATRARELLSLDRENSLAYAALVVRSGGKQEAGLELPSTLARRGLRNVAALKKSAGMSEDDFVQMSRFVRSVLTTTVGEEYLARRDHLTARKYLKEAVALNPNSGRHAYLAGLAYLNGPRPDLEKGYWLLARSVALTRGTPSGEQIAQFARDRYLAAGGKPENWNVFLDRASAAALPIEKVTATRQPPVAPPAEAGTSKPSVNGETQVATNGPSASIEHATPAEPAAKISPRPAPPDLTIPDHHPVSPPTVPTQTRAATEPRTPAPKPKASDPVDIADLARIEGSLPESSTPPGGSPASKPNDVKSPAGRRVDPPELGSIEGSLSRSSAPPELPTEVATNHPPLPPLTVRPQFGRQEPVSIGVLIEARIVSRENRVAVVYALSDMLRRLRDNDEAFIVSYGEKIGFEQDLTWNYDLLEKAMDRIAPQNGAALLDAVAFSAGHLSRVAKNRNRVLLVISDGSNLDTGAGSLEVASELARSGARVFCIGLHVEGPTGRGRLQELANRTGGQAVFISDESKFRAAAHGIASGLGIDFDR